MHVGVRDLDPRDHHPDAPAFNCFLDGMGHLFGIHHDAAHHGIIQVKKRVDLFFGDHQRMPRVDRPDVQKSEKTLIFTNSMTGDFAIDNTGE